MTTESAAQDRFNADNVYDDMRRLINTMSSVPGEFSLEELARVAVASADHYTLVRMAMDMLLHKGRQHCGGKIRRPDGEEGVMSDGGRGRFPRAVPVDRRGTSRWVGWAFSDTIQRDEAAQRRAAQAGGLQTEASRIREEITRQALAEAEPQVSVDPVGGGVITYRSANGVVAIDRYDQLPNPKVADGEWEGGDWLFHVASEYNG